jgi:tartrate-resistant acid phosphatase type 5
VSFEKLLRIVACAICLACDDYRGADLGLYDRPLPAQARAAAEPAAIVQDDASVPDDAGDPGRTSTRFAVLGDYGMAGPNEERVASLVKSWYPDFILTTGDNNYPLGEQATIDVNIGQYFHEFIAPYTGSYGPGGTENRFFPSLGNHDWYTTGAAPYLEYFTLPGNERYYDVLWESVHVFSIDSDPNEPDGVTVDSAQARWLKARLAASPARWQVVYMHHPPYSSSSHHGSTPAMQWPYGEWGADLVLAGHDHTYERLVVGELPYVVIGLGGNNNIYAFGEPVEGSQFRYNASFGAALVQADRERLLFRFFDVDNALVDELSLGER